jgi:predicted SnoaL-like aldol condensation-catalyzing enzyme
MPSTHDLYRRWLLELWQGDLGVADEIVADHFTGHWPDREVRGRDQLTAIIAETRGMMSALTFRLEVGPIAEGDLVAARWTGEGESAQGRMRFFGNDLLRVDDGRFAEYWVASWAGPAD